MLETIASKFIKVLPANKIQLRSDGNLLMSAFPYFMLFFIGIIARSILYITHNSFITLFIVYTLVPLLDQFFSLDGVNPTKDEEQVLLKQGWKYDLPLYITVAFDWWLFFQALAIYESYQYTSFLSLLRLIGFIIIVSNLNAAQFSVAHELMHKPGFKRVLGTWHMIKTLNIHFAYEHIYGHHRRVATPEDPTSAQKGLNVYKFFIRSYFTAYRSVFRMQLQKEVPIYKNQIVTSIIASILFCTGIFYLYSIKTFIFYLLHVVGALFYLQVINYIQHYGLRRHQLEDGTYQKVTIKHSWNSPHRFSNYLFFKLQRHSDHHENAMKPYQILLTIEEAAQLPHGYIVMTVMALFPSLFMRIMDPLVDGYQMRNKESPYMPELYKEAVEINQKIHNEIIDFYNFSFHCFSGFDHNLIEFIANEILDNKYKPT